MVPTDLDRFIASLSAVIIISSSSIKGFKDVAIATVSKSRVKPPVDSGLSSRSNRAIEID